MIKDWIINKLGGVTKEQHESKRIQYEKWAVENLTGKKGEVTPDCFIYVPFDGDDIVVIRSKIEICNGTIKALNIAPWCKDVITANVILEDSLLQKNKVN